MVGLWLAMTVVMAGAVACGAHSSTPPGQGVVRVGQNLPALPCEPPEVHLGDIKRFGRGAARIAWSGGAVNLIASGTVASLSTSEQASLNLRPLDADGLRDKHGDPLVVACLEIEPPDRPGVHAQLRYVHDGTVRGTRELTEVADGFDDGTVLVAALPTNDHLLL